MNIIKHGEELLQSGGLTWKRNSKQYQCSLKLNFLMEWPEHSEIFDSSQSEEEIVYISAIKTNFKSPLHFAWKSIFFYREFDSKEEILETISETSYKELSIENAYSIIWKTSQHWLVNYKNLLPQAINAYLIWHDGLDIYIALEDANYYYAWNWNTTA